MEVRVAECNVTDVGGTDGTNNETGATGVDALDEDVVRTATGLVFYGDAVVLIPDILMIG